MIYEVLDFLRQRLESSLSEGKAPGEPQVALSTPWSNNDNHKSANFLNAISLINVEEERLFKTQTPSIVQKTDGRYFQKEPDLKLNLYILVSTYHKMYEDGLRSLSRIVRFFQANNVFVNGGGPGVKGELPEGVEKIITELWSAGFEQQNQIWASLSTGYIPSVIYKIRMIIIDSAPADKPVVPVTSIKTTSYIIEDNKFI